MDNNILLAMCVIRHSDYINLKLPIDDCGITAPLVSTSGITSDFSDLPWLFCSVGATGGVRSVLYQIKKFIIPFFV